MKLSSVWIPQSVRAFASSAQVFDVEIEGASIKSFAPSKAPATHTLLPCFADLHVHIDKTFVVQDTGSADGDLFKAIDLMATHRASWTQHDLRNRMERALQEAYAAGTRAVRTHIDWVEQKTDADMPLALTVFQELQMAWRGQVVMQCVSLTPLDVFDDTLQSARIASAVAKANQLADSAKGEAALLGAFVYRNERILEKLQRVFDLAKQYQLDLDFHVDEGLDADACGLHAIAQLTIQNEMQGRVTCGHACSLSVQSTSIATETLAVCAKAGIHLVALPSTNLYLQGAWNRTPIERGITRLIEADVAGVSTSIATDNVADGFYPYGSYDLLETFGLGVQMAHLSPADDWLPSITSRPSSAMRLPWDSKLREGSPADVVLLNATNKFELLTPQGRVRRIIRNGQFL